MNAWLQRWHDFPWLAVRDLVAAACAAAVLLSVAWSFAHFHQRRPVQRAQRSLVDTLTMLLFFFVFCRILGSGLGALKAVPPSTQIAAVLIGLGPVCLGCVVNIVGRHQLGANWANQIAIYQDHQLMQTGAFGLVRHPLYASLIWMFLGASIAYLNWAALAITLLVFIPAMAYRAAQEERLLLQTFSNYAAYRRRTGLFFPKWRRKPNELKTL